MALKEKDETRSLGPFGRWPNGSQRSPTFEEIAKQQGVGPVEDPSELIGGWPGEVDDGFEEAVLTWRHHRPPAQD